MRFILLRAAPEAENQPTQLYGGAMAACWISSDSPSEALAKASALVTQSGWQVLECTENKTISKEDYRDDAPELEYFEQAVTDGEVCVFYTYPAES